MRKIEFTERERPKIVGLEIFKTGPFGTDSFKLNTEFYVLERDSSTHLLSPGTFDYFNRTFSKPSDFSVLKSLNKNGASYWNIAYFKIDSVVYNQFRFDDLPDSLLWSDSLLSETSKN